ncbi:sugar phosphate isomerase/epimerase [Bacillus thermophilus]|uniref:Sugar phosphate isomerase/epimerase n=1 Tax=Siminovitchia thermophila TaxID=1245522 RepID=A0ABS2RA80_9BACI|nr:sugar phosphate isomerase/epimerase family protein [Siminovitchia thermophila]MBM7716104.1 sugar phosphate isomerase/epimerase [Siminovitchia thermophila]ONK23034.1 hypothetical protein BLX87_12820 [Bacillus sp. VT-16-64]
MSVHIGICHWSLPIEGPYAIKLVSELGLQGIQLDIGSYERGFSLSYPVVQKAYVDMAKQYDVTITSLAVRELDHYGMTRENGTKEKDIAVEAVMTGIDIAESMGINKVMLPSFEDGEIKTEEDFNRVVECLQQACDKALNKNIMIATENLLSITENEELFKRVDRPNLTLYFDTQNYYLRKKYNVAEMADKLFPLICEVHVKDGKNNDLSGALLGEGDSNFFETINVFKQKDYYGWMMLENYYDQKPLSLTHSDPIDLLKKDISILKKTLDV